MKKLIFLLLVFFQIASLAQETESTSPDLKKLGQYFAGVFSSEQQNRSDSANYFNMRLNIARIWASRTDGLWFYVEHATHGFESKPYRQRVYRFSENQPGIFECDIFSMDSPLRFAQRPDSCERALTPDSLNQRVGCTLFLKKKGEVFTGGSTNKACQSERKSAKYTTTLLTVSANEIKMWERGYTEKDVQVLGPEKAGYVFVRKQ